MGSGSDDVFTAMIIALGEAAFTCRMRSETMFWKMATSMIRICGCELCSQS